MKYHADIRDQQCPLCGLSFHEYKTLKVHIAKIHDVPDVKRMVFFIEIDLGFFVSFIFYVIFFYENADDRVHNYNKIRLLVKPAYLQL